MDVAEDLSFISEKNGAQRLLPLEILLACGQLEVALHNAEVVGSIAKEVELSLGTYLIII